MKIGLDIHGVIDEMPEFFSFLTNSIIKNGGEVHIITGSHWDEKTDKNMKDWDIKFTHKFSVYDYLMESSYTKTGLIQFPDGTIQTKFEDELWDKIKGEYCEKNGISLHIDDTLIYNNYFNTPYANLYLNNKKKKKTHKDI